MNIHIRPAVHKDSEDILEIINHAILHTTAVYDYELRTYNDIKKWLEEKQELNLPVIVAEYNRKIIGYGTYGAFRTKEAFKFTVEHSVYINNAYLGKGIGKLILSELIILAKSQGYHTMIGCIDAENINSINFHEKFGFKDAGICKEVGYKFDRWLDLQFMQLILK